MGTQSATHEVYDSQGKLVSSRVITWTTTPEQDNEQSIRQQVAAALATNRTYTARQSPTAAQTTAQVQALSRQNNGLIRLLLSLLDGTD